MCGHNQIIKAAKSKGYNILLDLSDVTEMYIMKKLSIYCLDTDGFSLVLPWRNSKPFLKLSNVSKSEGRKRSNTTLYFDIQFSDV